MATVDELFAQAMTLSAAEREELANRLYQSTLPEVPGEEIPPEEAERLWMEEIRRRLEEYDRGEVTTRDAFEALNEIRRELRESHGP